MPFSTLPSVYARFHQISAWNACGNMSISETMLSFAPGELSTIEGYLGGRRFETRAFDPADLPCPPRSVMERKWCRTEPGQPH